MVDTNGFNKIQAAAEKAKTFFKEGTWNTAYKWVGLVQFIIRRELSNIDTYNILNEVKPLYLKNGTRITTKKEGIKFLL